jgi:transcription-repair coupling factor (superfamily II helicase)
LGRIAAGFRLPSLRRVFLCHHELFQQAPQRRVADKRRRARPVESFLELEEGDYVVHASHGIGKFLRMEKHDREGNWQEYLVIEYRDKVLLYVPVSKIDLVQRYLGGREGVPKLDRLGGKTWSRKKEVVERAVVDLAAELLELQALRNTRCGIPYPRDSEWQHEFEAAFPFEDTPDQEEATKCIKSDMENSRPMDRLVCGDVGYGKTELAMRAAFKAVDYGKQVAMLVPTTVLAQQHFQSFCERLSDYPVSVEVLSRFRSRKEQKEVLGAAAEGKVDILIGTHRLLQKDVAFCDLGLVIIDEEQRFGVSHKNQLKRLKKTVDVLTLTATPIPRTLQMALLGLREISSLSTPPEGRLGVHTEIIHFAEERIREAIVQEIYRGGQIYFVHNRVHSIDLMRNKLLALIPEARIAVVHGQMSEKLIEQRMVGFVKGETDVLLTTTIIESGLDITNVNTIFINDAQRFGLSELHQLRGRVGRYKRRAFAYLIVPEGRLLSTVARKRLKAIVDYSDLGAGFHIAMKDLEIRGAGNILGAQQHGHIAAVGYDMFCRLLERAVKKLKNEDLPREKPVEISLGLDAYIPESYISSRKGRIEVYRKITRIVDGETACALEEELKDRFGPIPEGIRQLILQARLHAAAMAFGIDRIALSSEGIVVLSISAGARLLKGLMERQATVREINEKTLYVIPPPHCGKAVDVLEFLAGILLSIDPNGKEVEAKLRNR